MNNENGNGLLILVIAAVVFPPFGAFLLLVGIVVLVFAFFDKIIGALLETKVKPFVPDETPDVVPDLWTKTD